MGNYGSGKMAATQNEINHNGSAIDVERVCDPCSCEHNAPLVDWMNAVSAKREETDQLGSNGVFRLGFLRPLVVVQQTNLTLGATLNELLLRLAQRP